MLRSLSSVSEVGVYEAVSKLQNARRGTYAEVITLLGSRLKVPGVSFLLLLLLFFPAGLFGFT